MNDIINKYTYLDTIVSDIIPFSVGENSITEALRFHYDISSVPEFLGVVITYLHYTGSGIEIEIVKLQGNYSIERNKEIAGEELYMLVQNAVENLNVVLNDGWLKQEIPQVVAVCPPFADMENDLNELAKRLDEMYV